jgi:hypothetical protein
MVRTVWKQGTVTNNDLQITADVLIDPKPRIFLARVQVMILIRHEIDFSLKDLPPKG